MVSTSDERLWRIEREVKLLQERQCISRFDNLMFLSYPLVILGLTLLTDAIRGYEQILQTSIMGVPGDILLLIVFYLGILFIIAVFGGFGGFLYAYASDELNGRVRACENLLLFPLAPVGIAICLFLIPVVARLRLRVDCRHSLC